MPEFDLGRVVGPEGKQGPQGVQGLQGVQGEQGLPGTDGVTPNLQIGAVTTLEPGSMATVTRRAGSTDAAPVFDFGIPRGDKGDTGGFSGNCFRLAFETWDWTTGVIRIPNSKHWMDPKQEACVGTLRQRIGRNALDYRTSGEAAAAASSLTAMMAAALAANTTTANTYPTAADGHIQFTWDQVQHYLLEGTLVSADEAVASAEELGFDWQEKVTADTEETVSLDDLLTAVYVPALGGASTGLAAVCTPEALQGLHLRRKADGIGTVTRYDLYGKLISGTWSVLECQMHWDLGSKELVLESKDPFSGEAVVMG